MSDTSSSAKMTQVKFTGKTSEYFGIWIVNLLLSIVTLGIYSAWAKVRRKKYFYHNTLIDNVGFDYHAKPMAILKGRIVAFLFFIGYAFGGEINLIVPAIFIGIFFLALPWLVVRSSIFNARNTSHRGLRFDFIGKVGEAALIFILLPIVTLFSAYLALPYMEQQRNKFMMNSHQFGLSKFDMKAKVSSFYKIYGIVLIVPLVLGILAAVSIPAYQSYTEKAAKHAATSVPFAVGFVASNDNKQVVLAVNGVDQTADQLSQIETHTVASIEAEMQALEASIAEAEAKMKALEVGDDVEVETQVEQHDIEAKVAEDRARVNALESDVGSDDGYLDVAEAKVDETEAEAQDRRLKELLGERVENHDVSPQERKQEAKRDKLLDMLKTPAQSLFVIFAVLAYLVLVFGFVAYFKSRIGNLIWNNTTLEGVSFKSSLRARDFWWIYLSNIIAIVFTFGLATPWAQVRLARYRASKLHIVGDVDFDQFVGERKEAVKATGEEIAEFFDVDFSFG